MIGCPNHGLTVSLVLSLTYSYFSRIDSFVPFHPLANAGLPPVDYRYRYRTNVPCDLRRLARARSFRKFDTIAAGLIYLLQWNGQSILKGDDTAYV